MKNIKTKEGLKELFTRYEKAGASMEELMTISGCIADSLAMDEVDYFNAPKELRKLWRGLD